VLDEFKKQVKLWMELDNHIKAMMVSIKEKRNVQHALTEKITAFMNHYNIEDLNTREGKLRYKVVRVKPPLRKQGIKEKLSEYFGNDPNMKEKVLSAVFDDQQSLVVEKPSLRRLKASNTQNI
jgi:hypothetical protein